jgi:hypothetical protein
LAVSANETLGRHGVGLGRRLPPSSLARAVIVVGPIDEGIGEEVRYEPVGSEFIEL